MKGNAHLFKNDGDYHNPSLNSRDTPNGFLDRIVIDKAAKRHVVKPISRN